MMPLEKVAWPSGWGAESLGPEFKYSSLPLDGFVFGDPNSTLPRFVNSQLVSLPPVGILTLSFCLIYIICLLISVICFVS